MNETYEKPPRESNPNETQDLDPQPEANATNDDDKSKQNGTLDKSKQNGTLDKSKQNGTLDKSKQNGTLDKSKQDATFDKSKREGTFDALNATKNISTEGSPRPGGYLTLGTQSEKSAAANMTNCPEKGSQTGDINECTCLSEKCKELAMEARLAAEAKVKEQPTPKTMRSYNFNEKKRAREAALKMVNLFAAMDESPPPDNWDVVEDEDEAERSRMRPFKPHPQTNLIVSTMSAVMLLAKGQQCKYKYMEAADTYLSTIKDEDGNAPPNVQGFLNLLHYKLIEAREQGWDKLDDNTYSTFGETTDFDQTDGTPPPTDTTRGEAAIEEKQTSVRGSRTSKTSGKSKPGSKRSS